MTIKIDTRSVLTNETWHGFKSGQVFGPHSSVGELLLAIEGVTDVMVVPHRIWVDAAESFTYEEIMAEIDRALTDIAGETGYVAVRHFPPTRFQVASVLTC